VSWDFWLRGEFRFVILRYPFGKELAGSRRMNDGVFIGLMIVSVIVMIIGGFLNKKGKE